MREIVFELCAETIASCLAARDGGAHRVELCSALSDGGVTPSHGLIKTAILRSELPVHVMIRPRGGNFVYSEDEVAVMIDDIDVTKQFGAAGVVLGLLNTDRTIDLSRTTRLVDIAAPLEVTFHRAVDATPDIEDAVENVILAGCHRVLTSGGKTDVVRGSAMLARLITQANGRIVVAAGGGLRTENAAAVALKTGARHFHGSLRHSLPGTGQEVTPATVREMMRQLRGLDG